MTNSIIAAFAEAIEAATFKECTRVGVVLPKDVSGIRDAILVGLADMFDPGDFLIRVNINSEEGGPNSAMVSISENMPIEIFISLKEPS